MNEQEKVQSAADQSVIDALTAAKIRKSCPNKKNCTKEQCVSRKACIAGVQRAGCLMPANLDLPYREEGDNRFSGECFSCGKCIHRCPRQNAGTVLAKDKGWLVLQIIKALILVAALWYIYR